MPDPLTPAGFVAAIRDLIAGESDWAKIGVSEVRALLDRVEEPAPEGPRAGMTDPRDLVADVIQQHSSAVKDGRYGKPLDWADRILALMPGATDA